MLKCKACSFEGSGTKVCPICYQRLIKERDELKRRMDAVVDKMNEAMQPENDNSNATTYYLAIIAIAEGRDNG